MESFIAVVGKSSTAKCGFAMVVGAFISRVDSRSVRIRLFVQCYQALIVFFPYLGVIDDGANKGSVAANSVSGVDVWSSCLCSFLEKNRVTSHCLSATANAWTIVFTRLNSLYIVVDPT